VNLPHRQFRLAKSANPLLGKLNTRWAPHFSKQTLAHLVRVFTPTLFALCPRLRQCSSCPGNDGLLRIGLRSISAVESANWFPQAALTPITRSPCQRNCLPQETTTRSSEVFEAQAALLVRTLPYVAAETCFALKGGTAINLFIRNLPRLSLDIDLVYRV